MGAVHLTEQSGTAGSVRIFRSIISQDTCRIFLVQHDFGVRSAADPSLRGGTLVRAGLIPESCFALHCYGSVVLFWPPGWKGIFWFCKGGMTVLNGLGRWDFGAEFKNIYLMPAEQFKSTLTRACRCKLLNCSGARFFAKLRKNLAL